MFGDMKPPNYNDDLLALAHDLAVRLLPAFEKTKNGIPFPRVGKISKYAVSEQYCLCVEVNNFCFSLTHEK